MLSEENNPETTVNPEQLEKSLINIATESWRFSRLFAQGEVNKLEFGISSPLRGEFYGISHNSPPLYQ